MMARAPERFMPEPPPRRTYYKLIALTGVLLMLVGIAAVLIANGFTVRVDPATTKVDLAEMDRAREKAAVDMIRMGAMNWQMVCAYEVGKSGGTRQEMAKTCTVDWRLGEPHL